MEHRFQIEAIRKLILSLPKINQNTLMYIVAHLKKYNYI